MTKRNEITCRKSSFWSSVVVPEMKQRGEKGGCGRECSQEVRKGDGKMGRLRRLLFFRCCGVFRRWCRGGRRRLGGRAVGVGRRRGEKKRKAWCESLAGVNGGYGGAREIGEEFSGGWFLVGRGRSRWCCCCFSGDGGVSPVGER
ncbi:hypothetical protein HAX54_047725 [Datura stramonium]|uniref:Uncharacterized protein n=1 Tax=Datura stramonium TaxID=4076 RepID=A0ABS8ST88_DATST|nr:hypothetical protein [Datura stramonium]